MNLILLSKSDFINDTDVVLTDRRFQHILQVHKSQIDDNLTIGLLDNQIGIGTVKKINDQSITLSTTFSQPPPKPLPITLIIALPRPKMIKRILQTCASMGAKKIYFINSYRVEKSYWQTPLLQPEKINEQLILGLEQAKDTVLPEVILKKRFKPFIEDELPNICKNTLSLVAHPNTKTPCPHFVDEATTLVIGPEGGFISYEVEKINQAGCRSIHIGDRILRVETAVPVLLGKLFD